MYTATITRRTRNLGFAVSNTPAGRGTDIVPPTAPRIVGTPGIVVPQADPERRSYGAPTAFTSERWFLGGQLIRWSATLDSDLAALVAGEVDSVEVQVYAEPPAKRPAAGRPETGTAITVRIPDDVLARCDAQPEGRAGFIRLAVERLLEGRRLEAEHEAKEAADDARYPFDPAWRPQPGDRVVLRWMHDIGWGDAPEAHAPQWTPGVVVRTSGDPGPPGAPGGVVWEPRCDVDLEPWCEGAYTLRTVHIADLRPALPR